MLLQRFPAEGAAISFSIFGRKAKSLPGASVAPKEAKALIGSGRAPQGLCVQGRLDLKGCRKLVCLPDNLTAETIDVRDCTKLQSLPPGLRTIRVDAGGCHALAKLPPGLSLNELNLDGAAVVSLPSDLRVDYKLDLSNCRHLTALPAGLRVGSLVLRNCTSLTALPSGLDVRFLDLSGCTALEDWPEDARVSVGGLYLRGCTQLRSLPKNLSRLSQLDLRDCSNISELPPGLEVTSWIDVANTGLRELPKSLDGVRIRWGRVLVDNRTAFHPEMLTAEEILAERNTERRRVMLDRFGFERFLDAASADVLDEDRDAGGPRRLLRVPLANDEPLVCLSVHCPSTGRRYLIRVPPNTETCRHAAAWIAGFDNPDDYRPIEET